MRTCPKYRRLGTVASIGNRVSRKGWLRFWCRARSFQSPWSSMPISVSASATLSNSGILPPHSPSTTSNGDALNNGVAMLPRKRVRTAWNSTGQAWRHSSARTIFVSGALPLSAVMGRHATVRDRSLQTRSTVRACKAAETHPLRVSFRPQPELTPNSLAAGRGLLCDQRFSAPIEDRTSSRLPPHDLLRRKHRTKAIALW